MESEANETITEKTVDQKITEGLEIPPRILMEKKEVPTTTTVITTPTPTPTEHGVVKEVGDRINSGCRVEVQE